MSWCLNACVETSGKIDLVKQNKRLREQVERMALQREYRRGLDAGRAERVGGSGNGPKEARVTFL